MAVVVTGVGLVALQYFGIATGCIRLIKDGKANTNVMTRMNILTAAVNLVSFAFMVMYVYEGWTNDTSGAGINKFHEKCTDQALGGWAYGFLIFYTAMFCLAGTVCVLSCFCACCLLCVLPQSTPKQL